MGRPTGVTVLAILYFIGAGLCVLGGIAMFVGGGFMATLANQGQAGSAGGAAFLAGMGAFAGVLILVFGAIYALLGWGLLKLKNWARIITIVLLGISIAFQLLGLLTTLAHFSVVAFIWTVFWLAVDALIIWYLLKPEVKAAFQGPQIRAASA
jgi:hypothetical protein